MLNKLSKLTNKKLETLLANTGDMALKRRARRIIEEINPQEGDRILEVGCGDGFYLHLLSNLNIGNLRLYGIDIDSIALKEARDNLKRKKVTLIKADVMEKLPFKADSFDKVIMSEVCEHLKDDAKGLIEVKRVLKKGGTLIVSVPNHNYPFLWDPVNWTLEHLLGTHIKSGFWAGLWNQHLRLYKPDEIKKAVKKAGFNVKKIESLTFWSLPFNHYLINLFARGLYSGNMSDKLVSAMSKFEDKPKRPWLIDFAFKGVGVVDYLNDIFSPKDKGVGVLVVAQRG